MVALLIATIKGTLVVLFFMHLRYSPKLTMVTVIASVFFLFIMFSLTMTDYLSRGLGDVCGAVRKLSVVGGQLSVRKLPGLQPQGELPAPSRQLPAGMLCKLSVLVGSEIAPPPVSSRTRHVSSRCFQVKLSISATAVVPFSAIVAASHRHFRVLDGRHEGRPLQNKT